MHELSPLIYDLAIMLGLAGLVVLLFQRIHQPVVLGYLVAGMIVGPHTPPHSFVTDIKNIRVLSELGVIFLMFSLGLEFSFKKLSRVGFSASVTGLIEVILMMIIGYGLGRLLGFTYYDALFLGAALSISSTTIIIKAIDELKLKTKRFAEIIFGVLIVEDLLAILLLVALSTIVITKNVFSMDMLMATVKLILVVGGWFILGYFLMPPLFEKMVSTINQETLTIISVALCLSLVAIAVSFHYSAALGAFIMGSILAETVLVQRIEEVIQPICNIFGAVFFITVGMLIDPAVILNNWPIVLLISAVTIIGKILTTSLAAFLTGQSFNTSLRVGFSMAQIGEFSFIIASLGLMLNVTSEKLYPLIVAVSGITTFTTPYLIRLSEKIIMIFEKKLPERMQFFLNSYSSWVYRTLAVSKHRPHLRTIVFRLLINGILVAIIFTLVGEFLFKRWDALSEKNWLDNVIFLFIALGISSPFIWGMLFSYKKIQSFPYQKGTSTQASFLIWFITLTETAILSISYFKTWVTILLMLLTGLIFFFLSFRHLENSYQWFEEQFLNNLKSKRNEKHTKYDELAPWDTHLVEIVVGENTAFAQKTFGELEIRERYGVNIVAVQRDSQLVLAPRGEEKIIPQDNLIVLGNDDQIDSFRKEIENVVLKKEVSHALSQFILLPYLLEKGNSLIGKTIRHSKIREKVNGLIVGLERNHSRTLNPDPNTILQIDDIIFIVGETTKIAKLSKRASR